MTVADDSCSIGPRFGHTRRELAALAQIEFAGSEHGNRLHLPNDLRDPEIWDAGVVQPRAQLGLIDVDRAEENERFAFRFVGGGRDRDGAITFIPELERGENFLLDRFVRHHLATDLGEAREPAFDEKKTILIKAAKIPRL